MAKEKASAKPEQATSNAAKQEIDLTNDSFYKLLEPGEKLMCKTWLKNNPGQTAEDFYNLRQKAKGKAKITPTEGVASHDGTFVTGVTVEEARNLHELGSHLTREFEQG